VKASDALLTLLAALTSSQGFLLLVDPATAALPAAPPDDEVDFDQDPKPYDFFTAADFAGEDDALANVSDDLLTLLAALTSSQGFLVDTAAPAPPDRGGDDFLFHEPMPYPARAEDEVVVLGC